MVFRYPGKSCTTVFMFSTIVFAVVVTSPSRDLIPSIRPLMIFPPRSIQLNAVITSTIALIILGIFSIIVGIALINPITSVAII